MVTTYKTFMVINNWNMYINKCFIDADLELRNENNPKTHNNQEINIDNNLLLKNMI